MTVTYTWEVTSMSVVNADDLQNIVIHTKWLKTGTDEDGDTGAFNGATPLSQSSLDPDSFIPFDELTEEIVVEWIQAELTDQSHIDDQIQKQIDLKKNPEIEKRTPWSIDNPI